MSGGKKTYFVSDVHLGLKTADPTEREGRFLKFLQGLCPGDVAALYLLGDIWDFWYEYRDVIPREGFRVIAALSHLVEEGITVHFLPGNHDVWCYSFFESLGIRKSSQPLFVEIEGKRFCLAHGDGVGGSRFSYRLLRGIFHSRILQALFSTLHPWLAYRFGTGWSSGNRKSHSATYRFVPENEPSFRYACNLSEEGRIDHFIEGHFHDGVQVALPGGGKFIVLNDWLSGGMPHAVFCDGELKVCA